MSITKNGIAYDLKTTPYQCTWEAYTFYFSSPLHLKNFKKKLPIRTDWINDSLSRRFHFVMDVQILGVLQLYTQIETRGFRVVNADREFTCQKNIILSGLKISEKD